MPQNTKVTEVEPEPEPEIEVQEEETLEIEETNPEIKPEIKPKRILTEKQLVHPVLSGWLHCFQLDRIRLLLFVLKT